MRRVLAVLLALLVVAQGVPAADGRGIPSETKAYLRALLPGAFGWRAIAFPAPTPTPKPVPPYGWVAGFCSAAAHYGDVLYLAARVRRFSKGSSVSAAAAGGQASGKLLLSAAYMVRDAREWPYWTPAEALRKAMIRLGKAAQQVAWAGVYEPIAPGVTPGAWSRYRRADRKLSAAAHSVDFQGDCP